MAFQIKATTVVHDHVVLLLDKQDFENPPSWLADNFNIIEGGTHAGGSSRNKLIVFQDGTYLELFNWIATPVEFQAWADKKPGLIDFALTTMAPVTAEQNHDTVLSNLSEIPPQMDLGVTYAEPQAGGRKRADGKQVQWKTSRPTFSTTQTTPDTAFFPTTRIDAPFFCHDITDRTIRVPYTDGLITTHPCGAVGIDNVQITVPESHLDPYLALYIAVTGQEKIVRLVDENQQQGQYLRVGLPKPVGISPAYVAVHATGDEAYLREKGCGIAGLTLRVGKPSTVEDRIVALGSDEVGSTVKLRM